MMLTTRTPFNNEECPFYKMIEAKKHEEFWKKKAGDLELTKKVKKLIVGMLAHNPKERYTMDKIHADPWF